MLIKGFQKTTLLDYPDQVASLVFTGGCNFRCPYCHNGELVLHQHQYPTLMEDVVIDHLRKRKGIIDGVVISGGEPTLNKGLLSFLERIKAEGVLVKLDTNGYKPNVIAEAIDKQLIDYIAMDLKGTYSKYAEITGLDRINLEEIKESIHVILNSQIQHEFRSTLMKHFHSSDDVLEMASYIKGAQRFVLQQYMESDDQLVKQNFGAYTRDELLELKKMIDSMNYVKLIQIRGQY